MNTEVHPEQLFDFHQYGQWLLACPQCSCRWTHIQKAFALEGSDPWGRGEHGELYNVPVGGLTTEQCGALVVELWGECNHTFEVRLQPQRGIVFIAPRMVEGAQ